MSSNGVNKVILIGNLGQDPDMRYTDSGTAIANLSVATSERWKDKDSGEKKEKTEWHRVVLFGKLAEIAEKYLKKGGKVYLEGKLVTRSWEKDGFKRYSTEVVVDQWGTMQMLGDRQAQDTASAGPGPNQAQAQAQAPNRARAAASDWDDGVPF